MSELTGSVEGSDEWEEEETTVVVELSGILESDFISQCDGECKVLGINTDKPLLQLDRYTFSGEYADTMGTNLIFTQEDVEKVEPQQFHEAAEIPTKKLQYLCKVDKKLNMSRVFVSRAQRDEVNVDSGEDNTTDKGDEDVQIVNPNINPQTLDQTAMSVDTDSTVTIQRKEPSSESQVYTPSGGTESQVDTLSRGTESQIDICSGSAESQVDVLDGGNESQMDVSSVETFRPHIDTAEVSQDHPGTEMIQQSDPDG
ncbi:general transcription factor 3C polypeptide 6-like [Ylistrum balloti]|uniref:general transcription factor 3C polypeptide 6-like n=1 Tax=Ylistrum balloti TaxID=509963 RepID=UPI0029059AAD|nr:general transcription factor 3C polypeptide 6-like [Ylistrum balloti]